MPTTFFNSSWLYKASRHIECRKAFQSCLLTTIVTFSEHFTLLQMPGGTQTTVIELQTT